MVWFENGPILLAKKQHQVWQDKSSQARTSQDTTRHDTTRHDKTSQAKTKQDKTNQVKHNTIIIAIQNTTSQSGISRQEKYNTKNAQDEKMNRQEQTRQEIRQGRTKRDKTRNLAAQRLRQHLYHSPLPVLSKEACACNYKTRQNYTAMMSEPKGKEKSGSDETRQDNTAQHNTTQHSTTQHNTTQHNTTQHNTTHHNTPRHITHTTTHTHTATTS